MLYAKDKYSSAEITIAPADRTVNKIREVTLDEASAGKFNLTRLDSDTFILSFKDHKLPAGVAPGKTVNVKLTVWLEGNGGTKPDATLTVKVKIA